MVDSKVVVDEDKVDAANVVTLNQFTFGAATASPDATALAVRLGVALLKDIDGRVVIDLPVQGSLGDPEFRIGKVVLRVIVNLLTKAAVSPFSLVGSMFGGGGEELAFQEFAPGSSELLPPEIPKLETLEKALANRPAVSLDPEGGMTPPRMRTPSGARSLPSLSGARSGRNATQPTPTYRLRTSYRFRRTRTPPW